MSRIFPAGGGTQISWMDKVSEEKEKLIGTAAIDIKTLRKLAGEDDDLGEEDVKPEDAEVAPEGEVPDTEEVEVEVSDEEGEEHEEGETKEFEAGESEEKAEAASAVEQAVEAVEKAKEALEEVSIALEDVGGEETAEVPVALEDEAVAPSDDAMVEVEIGADIAPIEDVGNVGGGKGFGSKMPPMDSGANAVEADSTLMAGSSSKFYKIASLSPANKKKLKDFWIGSLGYDPDYVAMMIKDYNPKSGKKD